MGARRAPRAALHADAAPPVRRELFSSLALALFRPYARSRSRSRTAHDRPHVFAAFSPTVVSGLADASTVFRNQRVRPFLNCLRTYSAANGRKSASASEKKSSLALARAPRPPY